ncbi:ABC transporter permease subunit [Jiangella alkaliphila]|uniref:ABC-2 family transporter protein n=1 Tax=Jiangella alkaliphila TaxID=419479 RepID=A0A1H2GMV5_9ACTN|nr:ABC transporter permease subunit [Jiangella alkaliphila]SDU20819.1 ABC-2 family transporter protein [Jiangella alkaliphila]
MIWVAWRQHRGEFLGAAILLAGLGVLLLTHGVAMHDAYERLGLRECQLVFLADTDQACIDQVMAFEDDYAGLPQQFTSWLPFLPMVAGMLLGAPLPAREFEQGTWQLAWTQSVTRTRWLATKLVVVFGFVLVASVVFAAGLSWWFEPVYIQRFTSGTFNHAVLVFPGYVLLGVAIGVLAGVVVRRVLVAAAVVIPAYLAVRIPVEFGLRPRYREPLTSDDPDRIAHGWPIDGITIGPGEGFPSVRYQPDDRFWQFQLIETAILLGIAVVLLAIAWRLVLGRGASGRRARPEVAEPVAA